MAGVVDLPPLMDTEAAATKIQSRHRGNLSRRGAGKEDKSKGAGKTKSSGSAAAPPPATAAKPPEVPMPRTSYLSRLKSKDSKVEPQKQDKAANKPFGLLSGAKNLCSNVCGTAQSTEPSPTGGKEAKEASQKPGGDKPTSPKSSGFLSGAKNMCSNIKGTAQGIVENPMGAAAKLKDKAAETAKSACSTAQGVTSSAKGVTGMIKDKANEKADAWLEKNVRKILSQAGAMILESAKAPGMPESMLSFIESTFEFIWYDVEQELMEGIMLKHGFGNDEYKENKLKHWVTRGPKLWPTGSSVPWIRRWLRARFLYATQPADATFFMNIRDPVCLFVFLVALYPGTSVLLFLVTFFIIDKTDEYQLVHFILKFKGAQFISAGLIPAAKLGISLYIACYENHVLSATAFREKYGDTISEHCIAEAPDTSHFIIILEPVRLCLIYAAALLLRFQGAYGGINEIKALESARIDAADGTLDGGINSKDLKSQRKSQKKEEEEDMDLEESTFFVKAQKDVLDGHDRMDMTAQAIADSLAAARERCGAELRTGFFLFNFIIYDACVVLTLFIMLVGPMFAMTLPPGWMLWTTAYYARMLYALCSFPFLLFLLPVVGQALHHAKASAYDKMGMLVPKLNTAQIKLILKKREKQRKRKNPKFSDAGKERAVSEGGAMGNTRKIVNECL